MLLTSCYKCAKGWIDSENNWKLVKVTPLGPKCTDFIHLGFGSANGSGKELCSKSKNPKYIKFVRMCIGYSFSCAKKCN